jgi:hypothetical protein
MPCKSDLATILLAMIGWQPPLVISINSTFWPGNWLGACL